jgi:cell division protein FtsB
VTTRKARRPVPPVAKRLVWLAVVLAALVFAIQGGEFSTVDLVRQRAEGERLRARISVLEVEVDSLERYRRALATDTLLQERIAREQFGMVKPGEILYRIVDSVATPPRP